MGVCWQAAPACTCQVLVSLCLAMEAGLRQQHQHSQEHGKYLWACRCMAEVLPESVVYAKGLLVSCAQQGAGALSTEKTAQVGSVLKLLMLGLTSAHNDPTTQVHSHFLGVSRGLVSLASF